MDYCASLMVLIAHLAPVLPTPLLCVPCSTSAFHEHEKMVGRHIHQKTARNVDTQIFKPRPPISNAKQTLNIDVNPAVGMRTRRRFGDPDCGRGPAKNGTDFRLKLC
jgi:hypothetical protein